MRKRVHVVENQQDLRAILRDFLSASGYTVIEAVDGGRERRQGGFATP
jgi:DNA-binding response OmpR family regulator